MATVKHCVKVTNSWKISPDGIEGCVKEMWERCILPFGEDVTKLFDLLANAGAATTKEKPYIHVNTLRYLEWDVDVRFIDQHLGELVAAGIIGSDEVATHQNALVKLALAARSPPRPSPIHARDLEAAAIMMNLYPEPVAVKPTATLVIDRAGAKFPVPWPFSNVYRHVTTRLNYGTCSPSMQLQGRWVPPQRLFAAMQRSEIGHKEPPVCPPAPKKAHQSQITRHMTGRPDCAKQLKF